MRSANQNKYFRHIVLAGALFSMTACSQVDSIVSTVDSTLNADINSHVAKPFHPILENNDIPTPTKTLACSDVKANQTIKVIGHTRLTDQCDFTGMSVKFVLDTNDTSLDCRGARFSQSATDNSRTSAITIRPKNNQSIDNITVANCHVTGYSHALHIRQKTNPRVRYLKGITDIASNQKTAPHDIRVMNVSSNQSISSGIFVDDHSYNVHFSDLLVRGSGTVGLYFEFGTQNNRVENSVFVDNGFRAFKPNREGIAVDSSAGNVIIGNSFIHNGLGGVMLYRNCFEHANDISKGNHFKRTQSSRDNIIVGNTFTNEPVGVWVASRQSRNLIGFQCGAYLMSATPTARYHLDSAKDNQIKNNRFVAVGNGIIVEDDGTLIENNNFQNTATAIKVGSEIRENTEYGAIKSTVIKNNSLGNGQMIISEKSKGNTQIFN